MDTLIIILLSVICIVSVICLILMIMSRNTAKDDSVARGLSELNERTAVVKETVSDLRHSNDNSQQQLRSELSSSVQRLGESLRQEQVSASKNTAEQLRLFENRLGTIEQNNSQALKNIQSAVSLQLKSFEERIGSMEKNNTAAINAMRDSVTNQMAMIRADNGKHLDEIRQTVDEKLQKSLESRLNESFKTVSEQLERVYKGIGEMQTLASGVGDLKKVLTNVKSRGILGEMQLGSILEQILSPEQYDTNVVTIPETQNPVEFAVKLPGDNDRPVYLPIDSKFPGDTYSHYRDECNSGDKARADAAWKELERRLKACADDISSKYVMPPYTTNFGIMFLPFEGLYAEAVDHGMVEVLQRDYRINIAGPSTMAAMLNSLQMGFRTLALQKRSSEVWEILGAVRGEFEKFNDALSETQKQLKKADDTLEKLVGTRSRQMMRKLRSVETLESGDSSSLLGLDE